MKRLAILATALMILLSACDIPDVDIHITVNPTEGPVQMEAPLATQMSVQATPSATVEPTPTATNSPVPSATPSPATPSPSTAPPNANATTKPTEKPAATAAPTSSPKATTVVIGTAAANPSITPQPTISAEATATPTPSPASGEITKLGSDYTSEVLGGINDGRSSNGLAALTTSADLNAKAEAHAKAMAEAGKRFHSSYGLIESVGSGTVGGMLPRAAGARASVHASQLGESANVGKCGIGAYEKDGTIYLCIVADLD